MKTKLLILGIDGATWTIIKPNLDQLPNIKKITEDTEHNSYGTINLKESPKSPSVWCSMFSGKTPEEHNHYDFHKDGEIVQREDIKVEFIWDILDKKIDIKALQVPFVYPPYNFNCDYSPPNYGLITDLTEMEENLNNKYNLSIKLLKENPDVFIVVFTCLDQLSHFYWGEPIILEWYKKIDKIVGELTKYSESSIIISDHGFCDWKDSLTNTLPRQTRDGREIKGDHHPDAIFITKNIKKTIEKPQDIFGYIKETFN